MSRRALRSLMVATAVDFASMSTWADEVRLVASNAVKEVVQGLARPGDRRADACLGRHVAASAAKHRQSGRLAANRSCQRSSP